MKNIKLKTTLSTVMLIALLTVGVMGLIHMVALPVGSDFITNKTGYGYLYVVTNITETPSDYTVSINWNYAGIFLAMVIIAFIAWLARICAFTTPTINLNKSHGIAKLICEILIGAGLVMTIISLFLPAGVTIHGESDVPLLLTVSGVLGWLSLPLATMSGIVSACLLPSK